MSNYLGRVLARSTGRSIGQIQPTPPRRWPGSIGDPDGAGADRGIDAVQEGAGGDRADVRPSPPSPAGLGQVDRDDRSAAIPRDPRPTSARSIEDRPLAARPTERAPSLERVRVIHVGGDRTQQPLASPASQPPVASESPVSAAGSKRRHVASDDGEPATTVVPPRAPAPTVPISAEPSPNAGRTLRSAPESMAVAPPSHSHPTPPPEPRRPQISIGRVSVIVEAPRPPAAAPRPIVRTAPASRPTDDGPSLTGRFGLGQR